MINAHNTMFGTHAKRFGGLLLSLVCFSLIPLLTGCNDDDPDPANENELITTLTLSLQKIQQDGVAIETEPVLFSWRDADGPGPGVPVVDDVILDANATYEMVITVLDESKTPAEDISDEIRDEDEDHQFFFLTSGIEATIQYDDADGNGNPVGLKNLLETGAAGVGSLDIILRHEPNKEAAGVSDGNPANAGGETDIEVSFSVTIQ
jgi:hypothetical protein